MRPSDDPELWWTTWTAILAGSLWIPFIVGVNTAPAGNGHDRADFARPADPARERPWVHRAHRAHLNLLEQFLPMAALVLIAHAAGMIARLARFPARPVIFTAGWACVMAMGAAILLA